MMGHVLTKPSRRRANSFKELYNLESYVFYKTKLEGGRKGRNSVGELAVESL